MTGLDLSEIDLRSFPQTDALLDQKIHSMSTTGKFWFDCLRHGYITEDQDSWPGSVLTQKFYNEYIYYAQRIGDRYRLSDSQFSKKFKKFCPGIEKRRKTVSCGDSETTRQSALLLPDLNKCRENFEKKVGMKINWDDENQE